MKGSSMTATMKMTVANIAFLLDRLAADTPSNQQIRELTQNALEAIRRRQQTEPAAVGLIRWDVDWEHFERAQHYKLSILDNGDGMTPDQMRQYLNSLAVQGANNTQSISQNFGVGAKITALYRNRYGLVYQSWRDGQGTMVRLHRNDQMGEYGLYGFDLEDGVHYTPRIKKAKRPRGIEESGTKVTLLGESEGQNTCLPPDDAGGMNWLIRYLTTRYFRLPASVKLQVRVLTRDRNRWPVVEPRPSEKTFNLQTIRGTEHLLNEYSSARGTVELETVNAHWWLFDDPSKVSKDMSTRGGRTCQVGFVFQDEVYAQRVPPTSRRVLAGFGIVFGAEHVAIYVEPRSGGSLEVRADTARSRVMINGDDLEEANWWEVWGAEFKEKMPAAIKAKTDEIMARSESDPDGKARERVLERLRRVQELLRPTRYRKKLNGDVLAIGETIGLVSPIGEGSSGPSGKSGRRSSSASEEYLADLVEQGGEETIEVAVKPKEPIVRWVSRADSSREEDELEDVAAEIAGSPATGEIIKANADFRGYVDVVNHFSVAFNPGGDEAVQRLIVECIREWMELQLVEAVVTVRNLANGRTWTPADLEQALSPRALTTLLVSRFHVIEKVKRELQTYATRGSQKAA
jgi:hypothetical protein